MNRHSVCAGSFFYFLKLFRPLNFLKKNFFGFFACKTCGNGVFCKTFDFFVGKIESGDEFSKFFCKVDVGNGHVVGVDGYFNAGFHKFAKGIFFHGREHAGVKVAGGAKFKGDSFGNDFFDKSGVFKAADTVAKALCAVFKSFINTLGAVCFARVNGERNFKFSCKGKKIFEIFGGEKCFRTGNIDAASAFSDVIFCKFYGFKVCFVVVVSAHAAKDKFCGKIASVKSVDGGFDNFALGKPLESMELGRKADLRMDKSLFLKLFLKVINRNCNGLFGLKKFSWEGKFFKIFGKVFAVVVDSEKF